MFISTISCKEITKNILPQVAIHREVPPNLCYYGKVGRPTSFSHLCALSGEGDSDECIGYRDDLGTGSFGLPFDTYIEILNIDGGIINENGGQML
jgi:hypothetical protein